MTYKDQFVVEVKVNGKILRVRNDQVFLPFGSEYSLLLKNLNSKRASVKISIDGTDVLDGNRLVIGPNQTTELEGFLKGSTAKNRFRFINKTKEIQDYRGDKVEDGLIRVEFAFEENNPLFDSPIIYHHHHYHKTWDPFGPYYGGGNWTINSMVGSSSSQSNSPSVSSNSIRGMALGDVQCYYSAQESINMNSAPLPEEGITVKGSEINQGFSYTSMGTLSPSSTIVIKLQGDTQSGQYVQEPLTVERKFRCRTCGRKYPSSFKYCSNCGTYLE